MDVNTDVIPHSNQVAPDFTDLLPSGYRFRPTDSELIIDYLNAKIESRELPKCRLHDVNIYNHTPEELAERYGSHENTWYFLTSRDRKYPKGNRPDRVVGKKTGFWKATQVGKPVYDASRQLVGHKRSLAFYIDKEHKTSWLMQEYTANRSNLPFGSGHNSTKLNKWVLCKIYKNKTTDLPSPKRRRVSENRESNVSNHPEHVEVQETNGHVGAHVQMVPPIESQRSANEFAMRGPLTTPTLNNNADTNGQIRRATFQGSNFMQVAPCYQNWFAFSASNAFQFSDEVSQPHAELPTMHGLNSIQPVEREFPRNIFPSTACNRIHQFPNGVLGSSSIEPLNDGGSTAWLDQFLLDNHVHLQDVQSTYQESPTQLLNVQNGWTQSMVVSDQDDTDHSSQSDGEQEWSVGIVENCLADENTPGEQEWSVDLVESCLANTNTTD